MNIKKKKKKRNGAFVLIIYPSKLYIRSNVWSSTQFSTSSCWIGIKMNYWSSRVEWFPNVRMQTCFGTMRLRDDVGRGSTSHPSCSTSFCCVIITISSITSGFRMSLTCRDKSTWYRWPQWYNLVLMFLVHKKWIHSNSTTVLAHLLWQRDLVAVEHTGVIQEDFMGRQRQQTVPESGDHLPVRQGDGLKGGEHKRIYTTEAWFILLRLHHL